MNLYLLRHGSAADRAASDSERALTEEGARQALSTAKDFRARGLRAGRCLVSPYRRARETAARFLPAAGLDLPQEPCDLLRPQTHPLDLLRFLQGEPEEDILLIGHNPLLSNFWALLSVGDPRATTAMGTADLVALAMEAPAPGCATTLLHLSPHSNP